MIERWINTPVEFNHPTPAAEEIAAIRAGQKVVEFATAPRIQLDQSYFRMKLAGSLERTFTRAIVRDRLESGLRLLPPDYGLIIFDAFRTIECQRALLKWMAEDAKRRNPALSWEEADKISHQFVADPDDRSRPTVPTHNSGGAVDLGLTFRGRLIDFGTDFDEPTPLSNTIALESDYDARSGISRERWMEGRRNRRLLFGWMRELGFTNLSSEWWHYDLGDFLWSRQLGIPWVFETMEPEVAQLLRSGSK